MLSREDMREITETGLSMELFKIKNNYMKIYDEYYSNRSTRDSAFLKDLVDSLKGISAVLEVYVSHKGIDPGYAIEKLKNSKSYIEENINYFENKNKEQR